MGTAYELDLSTIFTDADGDDMSYTVSVNGAEAVLISFGLQFQSFFNRFYNINCLNFKKF